MHHPHMSRQRIIAAERLLLSAQPTAHLLLLPIVDRVLMSRQVIAPAEDRIARLARTRIGPLAPMGPGLQVAVRGCGGG